MAKNGIVYAMGTGDIYIAPKVENPLAGVWTKELVSLRGTLKIGQADAEVKKVNIDQKDSPIVSVSTLGEVTVEFSLPNTAKSIWERFYRTVTVPAPSAGANADLSKLDAIGVELKYKEVDTMLRVDMKVGGQVFIFPNVDWHTTFSKEDDDNPTMFKVKITVKANEGDAKYDFIVLNPKV